MITKTSDLFDLDLQELFCYCIMRLSSNKFVYAFRTTLHQWFWFDTDKISLQDKETMKQKNRPITTQNHIKSTQNDQKYESNSGEKCDLKATTEMCIHCFDVLIQKLLPRQNSFDESFLPTDTPTELQSPPSFADSLPSTFISCPLFVTWSKERQSPSPTEETLYDLRGCIGSLQPKVLITAIPEYALISAFSDRRFQPIESYEIEDLKVSVSLLVNYEDRGKGLENCHDWDIGIHGIIIRFDVTTGKKSTFWGDRTTTKSYSATFLPEVAKEQA